jgi:hypothetical protein
VPHGLTVWRGVERADGAPDAADTHPAG